MASYLGLPPVPADLKPLASFLQRADELKTQDPIIAYWCAYHAAQIGISLRVPAPANRAFLSSLLTALEALRNSIGPHDAVDIESVSSAYVENFALRVFTNADNEDRSGRATRTTAKKFLAAACFLEVLKVFEDKTAWENHEDKVRYAKWKAADIAKAFREGRKPTPGPANATPPAEIDEPLTPAPPAQAPFPFQAAPSSPPRSHEPSRGASSGSSTVVGDPSSRGSDRDYRAQVSDEPQQAVRFPPPSFETGSGGAYPLPTVGEEAPGPGPGVPISGIHVNTSTKRDTSPPSSLSSSASSTSSKKSRRTRTTSLNVHPSQPVHSHASAGSAHRRSRTSSLSSAVGSGSPPAVSIPRRPASPTHFVPRNSPPRSEPLSAPVAPVIAGYGVPPPPAPQEQYPTHHHHHHSSDSYSPASNAYRQPQPPSNAAPPTPPPETPLTPSTIAKAQKHCRFAISALDYEDAEQARKELRFALSVLGG